MCLSRWNTCTGEIASRLLVLGARPFGITPGGGCRALFITLLQLATMVRIVSDNSWVTLLTIKTKQKIETWSSTSIRFLIVNSSSHPAQVCRQASMVAKVSGGSWALLGWSLSGARPPMMDGQRLFRKVTHAWMKGSCHAEHTRPESRTGPNGHNSKTTNMTGKIWTQLPSEAYPMLSDFVSQPLIKFEVFTARGKCSEVNNKGKWSTIQQHG